MSNGQLNNVSMSNAMQLVSQEPAVKTAVTSDGQQQDGGNFAGLLSGIQSTAKMQASPDSGQAGQPLQRVGEEQTPSDAGAENPAADLLAQISIVPQMVAAAELAAAMLEQPEEEAVATDALLQGSDPANVASRMVMTAYSQPGRMPEVNIPAELEVDTLQNAASAVTEQSTEKQSVKTSAQLPEEKVQRQQSGAGQFPTTDGQPVKGELAEPAPASSFQPAEYDRRSSAELPAQQPVDRSQNVTSSTAQPGLFTASNNKIRVEQAGALPAQAIPVQTAVALSSLAAPVPASGEPIAQAGAMQATPAEKTAGTIPSQAGPPADQITAVVATSSPESEIEVQISQPRPITAQAAAGVRQQLNGEQQVENVLTGSEQSNAKEMTSSRQMPVSDSESMPGSDSSSTGGSSQGQSDVASENGMLPHDMRGQLRTEQQSASAKAVPAEPLRQDIPEQVAQQVKERLVQHDVKPGNQQITLTLSPDSLGEIKMNLNLQGQKLSVEIVTENRAVRDAIIQHTDSLKESLARQNITMESFDVTTGGKGSANQGQNQNAWRELARQQQQQQFWTSPRGYQTAQAAPSSDHAAYQRGQGQTMLDIHY